MNRTRLGLLAVAALALLTSPFFSSPLSAADPLDWTFCRGPFFNGQSIETGLPDDWNPRGGRGSNVSWKRDDLGGRGTPIVMNGKIYVLLRAEPETSREGERVVCLDAASGKTIWENRFNVWLSDVPDTRVGWSSVTGDATTGDVYALGVCGYFLCMDGETGKTKWSVKMHERFGLLSTYGGRTNFPIVIDDVVIISSIVIGWGDMAKPAHRFVAFDKATGEVRWFKGTRLLPYDTTYSPPSVTVLNGQKALVFGSGDGAVWAIQPATGNPIWQYKFSKRGLNVAPVVVGDSVFMSHSEENIDSTMMGSVVKIGGLGSGDVTTKQQLWKQDGLMVGKSAPLEINGRLYCFDDRAKLHVLDAETGEPVVRKLALGTVMRSSPLYADGKIYAITANGRWYIMEPDKRKGVKILNKGRLPRGEESHASLICSHGRIYIQTTGGLYCLEDKDKEHGVGEAPKAATPTPVAASDKPTQLQIVPAETLLKPGEKVQFRARLFNERGQFLKEVDAKYASQGDSKVSASGEFVAGTGSHHAATVTATFGDTTASARIRVVPPLPWSFGFEELSDLPVTWVGARYRHQLRSVDGNKGVVKVTTSPKGTRSRCWFGHPELSDYTISADVRGAIKNNKMPDIGLIAQGYAMDMQGASQSLQIRSWVPQLRMAKTIKFDWKPNVWYSMKFRATVEDREVDGKKKAVAVLQGKIWIKDEDEPTAWTIEAVDESPNRDGSPGLYGNAKDAEIFLDNIRVDPNSAE